MDETDNDWQMVTKPKKSKSGEIKTVSDPYEENMNLMVSLNFKDIVKPNGTTKKENVVLKKKTQIPVLKKNEPNPSKKTESPASRKFTSLTIALDHLKLNELRSLLEATKLQFEKNDVIMLKTALTFLNEKLRLEKAEDLLFFDKSLDYPDSILSNGLKTILQNLIQRCSKENLQYFFHNLLQSLCEELNKSRSFVGHLILLQQIALAYPMASLNNLASTVILRNSYLNQPSICLSLFWALGCSGSKETTIGLKIWMEIISSVTNIKSYTKFSYDYLYKILSVNRSSKLDISLDEYKSFINLLMVNDSKMKLKDLQKIKTKCAETLTDRFIESTDAKRIESLFLLLLKYSRQAPEMFVQKLCKCIAAYPEESLNIWRMNFDIYPRQNVLIFNYLESNLDEVEKVLEHPHFMKFIKQIDYETYLSLNFVKDIPAKMTDNKKQKKQKKNSNGSSGSSCCRWLFGSFLLFGAIAGLITYDTQVLHGGKFEESSVGRVLKQTGALPHVENAWFVSLKYSAKGYKFVEAHAPVAYGKTRTFLQPYCEFAKDFGLTAINGAKKFWESTKVFAAEKTPVVVGFVDNYVPGLGQKIHDFTVKALNGFCSLTCGTWRSSVDFFKTKVFIGQFSPENLGKALNSTTERALTYYSWFHEKVDFYAKVK